MTVESATYINQLDPTKPASTDQMKEGDNHERLIKSTLKATFPNITGPITVTQNEINNLAQKDGSNLTTPALGDNSTKIATTAFVSQTSLSTNLPGQAGNNGKSLRTSGSLASWESSGIKLAPLTGGELSIYDANAILVNTAYTLPSLVNALDTFSLMALSNAASVPATIDFSDGWKLTPGFSAGTLAIIAPYSTYTAHGTWGTAAMTPPTLATVTGTGTIAIRATVMMPNGIIVVLYDNATDFKAVVFDTINNVAGSAINIRAATVPSYVTAYLDTSITLVVGYKINTTDTYVSGISLSGTSLSAGTATSVSNASPNCPMVRMQAGSYLFVSSSLAHAIGVSMTTCTVSAASSAIVSGNGAYISGLQRLTNTTALVSGGNGASGTVSAAARVITVSGTNQPQLGSLATASTAVMRNTSANSGLVPFDSTHFLMYGQDETVTTTSNLYSVSVSGTTASIGPVATSTTNNPTTYVPITYDYQPGQQIINYSATQILFGNLAGPYIVSLSGNTVTVGSPQLSSQSTGAFVKDYAGSMWAYCGNAKFDIFTISGATITGSEQITAVPTVFFTPTCNNKVVKYSGNWYTWNVSLTVPVSTTKAITISGSTITLSGNIS